jgi:glutamine synthetase
MGAGILKAFDDGIDSNLDPGEPEKKNIYDAMKGGKKVAKLPMTLGEAIDRLENDEVVKAALPEDMLRVFMHYKKDEWEKFLSAVTQWDVDTYLDVLP